MDPLEGRLQNKLFMNCIKFIVAMDFVLDIIKPFVIDKLAEFHNQLLKTVTSSCGDCTAYTEGNLSEVQNNAIRQTILSFHLTGKPSFLSSIDVDVLKYPWGLAKFYMSPMADNKTLSEEDADFQSCISVMTNNTHLLKYITDISVYDKAMDKRNKMLAHSSTHELSISDRDECFMHLRDILKDMKSLDYCGDIDIENLEKIRTSVLEISSDKMTKALKRLESLKLDDTNGTVDHFLKRFRHLATDDNKHMAQFEDYCFETLRPIAKQYTQKPQVDPELLRDDWNLNSFLIFIQKRQEIKTIPERYQTILRCKDGGEQDVSEWDLFLLSFIPSLPLNVQLEDELVVVIKGLKVIRDKLLDDPRQLSKMEFEQIVQPFREYDVVHDVTLNVNDVYNKEDNIFARFSLAEWQRMDIKANKTKVTTQFMKHIQILAQGYIDIERRLCEIENNSPSTSNQSDTARKHVTRAIVQILDGDDDRVSSLVTSPHRPDAVNKGLEGLENSLAPAKLTGIQQGCLIIEVECPHVQTLFNFWSTCLNGTLSDALEDLRKACQTELGLDNIRFEVVLAEAEVLRCMNIIVYDFNRLILQMAERFASRCSRSHNATAEGSVIKARFERLTPIDMADYNIQRCQFMPDGHLLLACWNCLLLVNKNLKDIMSMLDITVWDLAVLNDTEIVTVMKNKFMHFITVMPPNMSLGMKIDVGRGVKCVSIDVTKDKLYVVCEIRGKQELRILSHAGDLQQTLQLNNLRSGGIVTVKLSRGADKIFLSKWIKNEVACMSVDGQAIYNYVDDCLKGPEGVFVDDEENVIVCGFLSHNVHIVDRHGNKDKVVFTADDGLKFPHGICYRKEDRCLVVGQFGKLLPFKLSW